MFLGRNPAASTSSRKSRSLPIPPPPADEPQPGSPVSDNSSFFDGRKETATPLHNPWPPTPPQMSPYSSSIAVDDLSLSQEALIPFAAYVPYSRDLHNFISSDDFFRRPARGEENRFIRTFALTAEKTRVHFMIAYAPIPRNTSCNSH